MKLVDADQITAWLEKAHVKDAFKLAIDLSLRNTLAMRKPAGTSNNADTAQSCLKSHSAEPVYGANIISSFG